MTTALQAHLGQQLASGLDYLHKRRIIHRNICARHCYVSYGNTVKIGDLHLAREYADPVKFKDDRDEGRFSVKVSLCSLPQVSSMRSQFLAPELLQGDIKKFSTESDVWSFGMLLWEIVTRGTSPFLQVRTPPLHTSRRSPIAQISNQILLEELASGSRPPKPRSCEDEVLQPACTVH